MEGERVPETMRNVLLLGADPATVSVYRMHFERAGVTLASAEIVEPVADFIRLAQPSAVLLDVTRATSDGEELLRGIRAEPEFRELPLFALTDSSSGNGRSLGTATRSFPKASSVVTEVVKTVTQVLNGSKLPEQSPPAAEEPTTLRVGERASAPAPVSPRAASPPPIPGPPPIPAPIPISAPTPEASVPPAPSAPITAAEGIIIEHLDQACRQFAKAAEAERNELLQQMQEHIRNLRRNLLVNQATVLAAFASSLARLVMTLSKDLARVNASSLRTLLMAVETLSHARSSPRLTAVEESTVRVLVLDDEALSRRAVQFALGCPDLEVADCDSIPRALESFRDGRLDVVFTENKMVRNGEFVTQLRQVPGGSEVPIVVITPLAEYDARTQSPVPGFDWIAKPFTPSEMVVKAFTFGLRRRLGITGASPAPAEAPAPLPPPALIAFTARPEVAPSTDHPAGKGHSAGASAPPNLLPAPRTSARAEEAPAPTSAELVEARARIAELERNLQRLEEEIAARDSKIAREESELQSALSQVQSLTQAKDQFEKRLLRQQQEHQEEQQRKLAELAAVRDRSDAATQEAERGKERESLLRQELQTLQESETRRQAAEQRAREFEERLSQERTECERLRAEVANMQNIEQTLKSEVQDREQALHQLRESLAQTTAQCDQEAERRRGAEEQLKTLSARQAVLEEEAARRTQQQDQSNAALSAEAERLKAQLDQAARQNAELHAKLNGSAASEHRAAGHPSAPAGGSFQERIDEMTAYDLVAGELSRVRNQLAEERSQRQKLQTSVRELEDVKDDLTKKLDTLSEAEQAHQQTARSLEAKLKDTLARLTTMENSLQAQSRECRRLQQRASELEEQVNDLSSQLTTQAVIEQSRRRRESELEACIVEQQAQIANSKAALAAEGAAMQRTRERIHFALCRVIQELTDDKAALAAPAQAVAPESQPEEEPAHAA